MSTINCVFSLSFFSLSACVTFLLDGVIVGLRKKLGDLSYPPHYASFGGTRGVFSKVVLGFQTWDMTYEGLWEMFEGDFADMCDTNFCWCRWGAGWRVKRAKTRKQGPPSAPAELFTVVSQSTCTIGFGPIVG